MLLSSAPMIWKPSLNFDSTYLFDGRFLGLFFVCQRIRLVSLGFWPRRRLPVFGIGVTPCLVGKFRSLPAVHPCPVVHLKGLPIIMRYLSYCILTLLLMFLVDIALAFK